MIPVTIHQFGSRHPVCLDNVPKDPIKTWTEDWLLAAVAKYFLVDDPTK